MGTLERRERERQALRRQILEAARDLFVREGFEAVTMRRIAEAIDYSATALYKHFQDKEALITALLEEDFEALLEAFKRHEAIADPVERLMRHFDAYVAFALAHPDHYRLMFMTPKAGSTCGGGAPAHAYGYILETVAACIEAGAFRPELAQADAIAQTLWGSLHGVISLEMLRPSASEVPWTPLDQRLSWLREMMGAGLFIEPLGR